MPNGEEIKNLPPEQSYKYLEILQAENIKETVVKSKRNQGIHQESKEGPEMKTKWWQYDQSN